MEFHVCVYHHKDKYAIYNGDEQFLFVYVSNVSKLHIHCTQICNMLAFC